MLGKDALEAILTLAEESAAAAEKPDLSKLEAFRWLLTAAQAKRMKDLQDAAALVANGKAPKRKKATSQDDKAASAALDMFK